MKFKSLPLITIVLIVSIHFSVFSQVPPYVPTANLVGYWGFNGNANDDSGNNNHGTPTNVFLTSDRFGNENSAYLFNGSTSRIDITNAFFNVGWESFTISCWTYSTSFLNPNNYNDSQVIINTDPHNGIAITLYGENNPFSEYFDNKYVFLAGSWPNNRGWDIVQYEGYSNTLKTINNWNHVALVKNGKNYDFYINGILDKTVIGNTNAVEYYCKMVFGGEAANIPAEVFLGKLDDYGIWNRALSSIEITSLYNSTPCLNLLNLTSPIDDLSTGNHLKGAVEIKMASKITGEARLNLNARSVELNPGFSVNNRAVISTSVSSIVGGCN
ncbi:LamG domain-containing protein [Emticicia sp. C21]|uniref:LamG domain-containing protein n=1 Tax=Emticicia sp. C21 TaxID=2302915 RepID=UPI000E34C0D3|nr:LamG domain-containing protein [Emticicia sp. C21]RFS16148.1 LamG domain-containing protein [Emticicia sp. C21]